LTGDVMTLGRFDDGTFSQWDVMTVKPRHIIIGSEQWRLSGGQEGKLSGLFCAVLCAKVVHSEL